MSHVRSALSEADLGQFLAVHLSTDERGRVVALVNAKGEVAACGALGVSSTSLYRALAGRALRVATIQTLRAGLEKAEQLRT